MTNFRNSYNLKFEADAFYWGGVSFLFMDCVPAVMSEIKAQHWALKEWPLENRFCFSHV